MKRILCIVGGMNAGGAETFLMKIYRQLDKRCYQMDFCVSSNRECFYDKEILSLGGKIFHITKKSINPIKNFYDIIKIVKKGNYKSVIRVSQHSMSSLDLLAAKIGGAKKLIFRSSNSNSCGDMINTIFHKIFMPCAIIIPNIKIAPSDYAAEHMFGKKQSRQKKITIIKNGLPVSEFKFNSKQRATIRKKLGIENKFVIGHVGRMTAQKNHLFLLDVFREYLKINKTAILLLIGDGELRTQIEDKILQYGISDNAILLGVKKNIAELYNVMDCFVFPSLYEGMPNTVIEAQTNGLSCVVADTITPSVKIAQNIIFCSLDTLEEWPRLIRGSLDRRYAYKLAIKEGYNIKDTARIFTELVF